MIGRGWGLHGSRGKVLRKGGGTDFWHRMVLAPIVQKEVGVLPQIKVGIVVQKK